MSKKAAAEITVSMTINVDGAPTSYGPDSSKALDHELNAHVGARASGKVVGYLTDQKGKPIVQGSNDPAPGFYISQTAYVDRNNPNERDPRRYVNAAEINYTLWAAKAKSAGVKKGDFCVVHSLRTNHTVYAIVGDAGNSTGAEGSLALLQRLGYAVKNGKAGGEDSKKIVVRYFANSNPDQRFFFTQAELDTAARALDLDTDFTAYHPGLAGILVLAAAGHSDADAEAFRVLPFAPLAPKVQVPAFPGRLIRRDSKDSAVVRLIQQRLRDLGYWESRPDGRRPLSVDGDFGQDTEHAVELFQARHSDLDANPLEIDGRVGIQTWGALFGRAAVVTPVVPAAAGGAAPASGRNRLLGAVLDFAISEIGVKEDPLGSNKGKRVVEYLASVGFPKGGEPWCAAFVYFCFQHAARQLGLPKNPVIRSASVLDHWNRARAGGVRVLLHDEALDDPREVKPGMIFIISTGNGTGHTGLVKEVVGGKLVTIEGNTNDDGSREGVGVFQRIGRSINSINRGFIDYSV